MMENEENPLMTDENIHGMAALIHGVSNPKSTEEERIMFGSSLLNRIKSGRGEFGIDGIAPQSINEAVYSDKSPYYESQEKVEGKYNERYRNAFTNKVATYNEKEYKRNLQIARGLLSGDIESVDGQFFFTDEEVEKLKRKKKFDFNLTDKVSRTGKYNVFTYKQAKKKDFDPEGSGMIMLMLVNQMILDIILVGILKLDKY